MCVHLSHGKNIVKRVTQVNGQSLKLHFCMLEISKVKHNSLNCNFFLEYFPLIAKFTSSKLDTNQECFCMFKALKPREWIVFVFFKCPFFYTKYGTFLLKIEKDFNIDD